MCSGLSITKYIFISRTCSDWSIEQCVRTKHVVVKVFKLGIYGLEIELVWKLNWWHVRMALVMKVFELVIQIYIGFED